MKKWLFRTRDDNRPIPPGLARAVGLSPLMADLLWRRNFQDTESIRDYLNPTLKNLFQPTSWAGVSEAADVLVTALLSGKKLLIWGDYDVDGVTATAVALQVLRHHGFSPLWHLPDRQAEGYGLNISTIDRLAEDGIEIIMTVDCGISDVQPIEHANKRGLQVVVTDHHLPPSILPDAAALCNPQLGGSHTANLAGVGIVFFLMAEVNNRLAGNSGTRIDMRETLDLVALGTLADMVPLEGQNRVLAKNGLLKIAEAKRQGLAELKVVSGFQPLSVLGAGQVVFSLVPRLNAAGRMSHAAVALDLLCETEHGKAAKLAAALDTFNAERRHEEERIMQEAVQQAEADCDAPALVLYGQDWFQGVIGIVASRIMELFHKPTMVLCADGSLIKGSGRSIKEFNLYSGLERCGDLLENYGGHSLAAGMRIAPKNYAAFLRRFRDIVLDDLGSEPIESIVLLDGELDFSFAKTPVLLQEIEIMQPFGVGNPTPVFASPPLRVRGKKLFGPLQNNANLELQDTASGITLHAKLWKQAAELPSSMDDKQIRIAYTPSLDKYNGLTNLELRIKDFVIES